MSNIVPFEHQRSLAQAFVKSKMFGIQTEEQALALMALCEAEGLHPAKAIQEYHIIQGRPALKADAMLARFQQAGGSVKWLEYTDKRVCGIFTHAQGGSVEIDWTFDRAKSIGLAAKDNWKNYPRNMLRARCISEGVRAVYPGIAVGIYTVEEVQDMPSNQVRDMGQVEIVSPWNDELKEAASIAASKGMTSYTNWWKGQSTEFREAAVKSAEHADFKSKASEAVIDSAN